MPQGFFNSNEGRAFPFAAGTVDLPADGPTSIANLPNAAVVDCGFLIGAHVDYDPGEHSVFLTTITRTGDTFVLVFESDCPTLFGIPLSFVRTIPTVEFATEHTDSGQEYGSLSEATEGAGSGRFCGNPLWSGYLVTGDLTVLDDFLPGDGTVLGAFDEGIVEPALIQTLRAAAVTSLAVANADRTRVTAPAGCDEESEPLDPGLIFVGMRCMIGRITVRAGYNCAVRQAARDNSLVIGAAAGTGAGPPCDEVPVYADEAPPDGSSLLSGGPQCNEVLRSINGVGGPMLRLIAGTGIVITPVPEENRIKVDVNMSGLITCFESEAV